MKAKVDIGMLAAYVAGGGLSGATAFAAVLDPKHALIYAAAMGAVISIAGAVRVIVQPTPPAGTVSALIAVGQVPVTVDRDGTTGLASAKALPGTVTGPTSIASPAPKELAL